MTSFAMERRSRLRAGSARPRWPQRARSSRKTRAGFARDGDALACKLQRGGLLAMGAPSYSQRRAKPSRSTLGRGPPEAGRMKNLRRFSVSAAERRCEWVPLCT